MASVPSTLPTPDVIPQNPTIPQLLELLKSCQQPKTRQWAARTLAGFAQPTPTVVETLARAASADASDDVRDACLHGLLHFGIADPALLAKVDWPQMDDDLHVREAAWRHVLFGTEASGSPRVREAAKALKEWFHSQPPARTPGHS
jgi:hypothetical protein